MAAEGVMARPAASGDAAGMWASLHRARRRLGGDDAEAAALAAADTVVVPDPAPVPRQVEDIVIVFGRAEIDRLRHALQTALGDRVDQPNTPARIEAALGLILSLAGSPGRARVLRRPAAVSTPEAWEVHLDGAEPASGIAIRNAGQTGRFSA